jgi:uncharacterized protein (TIGR02145 family)
MKNQKYISQILLYVATAILFAFCGPIENTEKTPDVLFANDTPNITPPADTSSFLDSMYYAIKGVVIGKHEWMNFNLYTDTFQNGDIIPLALTDEDWQRACKNEEPACTYYQKDLLSSFQYRNPQLLVGKLYNWFAVNDSRGLAPSGWHIPSDAEWTQLIDHLGGSQRAAYAIKSEQGWYMGVNGSNSCGFNGIPGGERAADGSFKNLGRSGVWWSRSDSTKEYAWFRSVSGVPQGGVYRSIALKHCGFYIRCIKNSDALSN